MQLLILLGGYFAAKEGLFMRFYSVKSGASALVLALTLTACAAPPPPTPIEGVGATPQARIASAAGIDVAGAIKSAEAQGFNNARDAGFAVTEGLANGGLGLGMGVLGILAAPAPTNSYPLLIIASAEKPSPERVSELGSVISQYLADSTLEAMLTYRGRANGKNIYLLDIYSNKISSAEQLFVPYAKLAQSHPDLVSAYMPPMKTASGWAGPYLIHHGKKLPL